MSCVTAISAEPARRLRMLGVLGGMGPAATADFIAKLIARSNAAQDDEHVPCIVSNDPRIPDRTTAYLERREADVLDALVRRLHWLEEAGAEAIAMPCNSAHHWAEALERRARAPLLHIADASLAAVRSTLPDARRVAIMATPVTVRSGFYQRRMAALGLEHHEIGDDLLSAQIVPGIRLVKAGDVAGAAIVLRAAVDAVIESGADAVLLACTEIPIALAGQIDPRLIDTNAALADACVAWARGDA